jgi:DNA-binding IclR family transcriptional regulator
MLALPASQGQRLLAGDRRDHASRDRLLRRVREEFREMPGMRLTGTQAARLFGLSSSVCRRILATLVSESTLWVGSDGRFALRARQ